MTIYEATKRGKKIYRTNENYYTYIITPTNAPECCLIQTTLHDRIGVRWNPRTEDLLATDWEVYSDEKA